MQESSLSSAGDVYRPQNDLKPSNRPKYPAYHSVEVRIKSYNNDWPTVRTQTPLQLSQAGFFYAGLYTHTLLIVTLVSELGIDIGWPTELTVNTLQINMLAMKDDKIK